MRPADIVELIKTLALDVREFVAQALEPIVAKQAELEQRVAALPTEAIKGERGERGANAYEISCAVGYRGTVEEWVESLHGKDGKRGADGKSVTLDEIEPLVEQRVKDINVLGPDAVDEQLAKSIAAFVERLAERFNEEPSCG